MKESCRKGVANHPDPEPCEGGPLRAHLKRWEGAYAGWVSRSSELRNRPIRELTVSSQSEGNRTAHDIASAPSPGGVRGPKHV